MKDLIGYCGLDCETCGAYIATVNDDQSLREKTAKLWAELNNVSILPEHINCEGSGLMESKRCFASICAGFGNVLWEKAFPLAAAVRN